MAGKHHCRVCRAMLTDSDEARSPGACPYCGAETAHEADPIERYTPPRERSGPESPGPGYGRSVPWSAEGKFFLAIKLFLRDLPLILPLFLMVWLPGYLLIALVGFNQPNVDPERTFGIIQLANLVEFVFGPLYIAGTLSILADRMTGQATGYRQAFFVATHNWARLVGARFVSNLIILAGCIALLVPGIIFAVRYALIDPVVVLEGAGVNESRARSTQLAKGKGMEIFVVTILYTCPLIWVGTGMSAMIDYMPALNPVWAIVLCGTLGNLYKLFFTCYFFVYFWEGHVRDPRIFGDEPGPDSARDR